MIRFRHLILETVSPLDPLSLIARRNSASLPTFHPYTLTTLYYGMLSHFLLSNHTCWQLYTAVSYPTFLSTSTQTHWQPHLGPSHPTFISAAHTCWLPHHRPSHPHTTCSSPTHTCWQPIPRPSHPHASHALIPVDNPILGHLIYMLRSHPLIYVDIYVENQSHPHAYHPCINVDSPILCHIILKPLPHTYMLTTPS